MVAELKNQDCLENDIYSTTDTYIIFKDIYSQCLEDDIMPPKGSKGYHNSPRTEFKTGCNSWILMSEEDRRDRIAKLKVRMSLIQKGKNTGDKNVSKRPDVRKKISKALKGKKHSEETKRKISESRKGKTIGDINPSKRPEVRIKISKSKIGITRSKETKRKLSEYCGEEASNWKGGISFLPYCHKFNKQLKERIRKRDGNICQLCHEKENGRKLSVHHIHYDKENCYPDLITLCAKCNLKVNFNREYYEMVFMNILNERGLLLWAKENV